MPEELTLNLQIKNGHNVSIHFQIEPSGNYCPMPAGAMFEIELRGRNSTAVDMVEVDEGWVRLWMEKSAYIRVTHDGVTVMDA